MMGKGRTLRAETKHYVPKLIAAALIAKHPERFGFRVDYDEPREFEEVRVPDATDLHVLANAAGITFEDFRDLNPELRRFCTPPGGWTVKLPKGKRETFLGEYAKLDAKDRLSFTEHRVEKGEPLSKIARAYGVRESAILRTNGLKSYRQIKPGRILVIPMAGASRGLLAGTQLEDGRGLRRAHGRVTGAAGDATGKTPGPQPSGTLYTVRPGDTLWRIAAKFSTTVDKLCKLNGLTPRQARALQVGQTLAVRET
jgi:membrane-bound lytic murein transglycosylase D